MSSLSPPSFSTDNIQADPLGSHFSHSSLQSPQPSPLIFESPELNFLLNYTFLCAGDVLTQPQHEGISPTCLGGEFVGCLSAYDPDTPSPFQSHHPALSEIDDGSTASLSTSPTILTPTVWPTCVCGCGGGSCIYQRPYRRPKGDPLEDDRLGELVTFRVHGQCGIPLKNALRGQYGGLTGRDDPMFVGSRTSISIRLEWPDCPSWAEQMRTKDWRRKPSPITKAKLATEVAKKVDRFLKEMHRNSNSSPWLVDFNHLALVALEHVSLASWQPHVRVI